MVGGTPYANLEMVPDLTIQRASKAWGLTTAGFPVGAEIDTPVVVPGRGLVVDPPATRLNDLHVSLANVIGSNTTVTPVTTTMPDGSIGTAWRIQMPASGGTFVNLTGLLSSTTHTTQVWIRDGGAGNEKYGIGAGNTPVEYSATPGWQHVVQSHVASGSQAATINNRFDLFATDIIVAWPDVQQNEPTSPILEPGSSATRAATNIQFNDITTINNLPPNHQFDVVYEDGTGATLTAVDGVLTIPVAAKAYRSLIG